MNPRTNARQCLPSTQNVHDGGINCNKPFKRVRAPSDVICFRAPQQLTRALHTTARVSSANLTIRHFAPKTKRVKTVKQIVAAHGHALPQKIAIVGGGLAGLSVAYHLLHSTARYAKKRQFDATTLSVTIFDAQLPGEGGASAAAAGLLHPFTPRAKKKVWKADSSMAAALDLLEVVQTRSEKRVAKECGLLRLALSEKMEVDFQQAANRFAKDIEFLDADQVQQRCPGASYVPGVFIRNAVVVDTPDYLRLLWKVCEDTQRAWWRREKVCDVKALLKSGRAGDEDGLFDTVVLCAGVALKQFSELDHVPLTACRGQNLVLEREAGSDALNVPLISGKYVVPDYFSGDTGKESGTSTCKERMIGGATFEYKDDGETEEEYLNASCKKDASRAIGELEEPLHKLMPYLYDDWKVVDTISGTRALPPRSEAGSIPIAVEIDARQKDVSCWLFTGLGSRGLLHHSYIGKMVARAIVAGNDKLIPAEARRFQVSLL